MGAPTASNEDLLERVRAIAARVLHGQGARVYLFGSHASGRPHRLSDVDIAVEGTHPLPAGLLARLRDAFEESDLPVRVDVLDVSETDEAIRRRIRAELSDRSVLDNAQRDAAFQRFEYTFEATWKACQRYLLLREGIDAGSPKTVIRAARDADLLDDAQTESALRMTDDRNLTVHTYNEALAAAIASRLPEHARLLSAWLDALARAVAAADD